MRQPHDLGPRVTIIMPTFQHAEYVGQAIASVLAQTFHAWELIVVDDGSTDGTLEAVRGFGDPRIRPLGREHRGLAELGDAYAAAIEASSAPLVAVLEGDDHWPPDKLARQVPDFDDPSVVLSYGEGGLIDEAGCVYGRVIPSLPLAVRTNRPAGSIVPALLSCNSILSPTVVLRRSALDAIGGFWQPEGVPYVDHPTWLLLARQGAFGYHNAIVGYWRRHSEQWTTGASRSGNDIPEAHYIASFLEPAGSAGGSVPGAPSPTTLSRSHSDRAMLNRWRFALLSGSKSEVLGGARRLVASGRPRLIVFAWLGVAAWLAGSDLEWLQLRRNRVAWPPRRHRHRVSAPDDRPLSTSLG